MGTIYHLTPHLQALERQQDCDPAGVVRQPASGGIPVSCLRRAGHVPFVVCVCVCAYIAHSQEADGNRIALESSLAGT